MSFSWQAILSFLIVLGSVVLFHEFGHYLAAKAYGITVEIFSVGFGPRIWGFLRRGTEYRLSWIPLGGYVKLKGETSPEDGAPPDPGDLMAHSRFRRFVVFAMGAIFNLATAFFVTQYVYMHGVEELAYQYEAPVIGEVDPESAAVQADLRPGDKVLEFDGKPVANWKELEIDLLLSPGQTRDLVVERDGARVATRLHIGSGPNEIGQPGLGPATGVLVGSTPQPGMPAAAAGLQRGDRIAAIDGAPMPTVNGVVRTIQESAGKPLHFTIEREGRSFDVDIVPREDQGKWRIGFAPTPPTVTRTYAFAEAARQSLRHNVESVGLVFLTFKKLLTFQLSVKAFSGPIDLYRFSEEAFRQGFIPFLNLIAFVSLQLGIINLFPIPPLDGGHLFTLIVEGALRRDLSLAIKERVMQAGLILLLLFMGTVIYFDISKNFFR